MMQLLEKAMNRAKALPDSEQDAVAAVILSELEADQRWDRLFKSSQDVLGLMAREALEECWAGEPRVSTPLPLRPQLRLPTSET